MLKLFPLYVLGFCSYISFTLLFPVIPDYAASLGASVPLVGLAVGISSYITALLMIPFGMLSDRIGRRTLLLAGLVLYIFCPLLYLVVSDPIQLLLVRAFHGLASAAFIPVVHALVVDMAPVERRGEAMGWYTASTQLSFIAGPLIGGFILNYVGFDAVFYSCGVIPFLGLLFILPRLAFISPKPIAAVERSWGWMRQRRSLGALLTPLFITIGSGTIIAFMPLYGGGFGIEAVRIGIIITAVYASSALLRAPAGWLSDRIGREPLILGGFLTSAVAIAFISFLTSFPWLVAAAIFFGLGMGLAMPASFALVADLAPPGARGLTMGVANSFLQAGIAIGATVMGAIAGVTGFPAMFRICALSLIAGLAIIFYLIRSARRRPSSD